MKWIRDDLSVGKCAWRRERNPSLSVIGALAPYQIDGAGSKRVECQRPVEEAGIRVSPTGAGIRAAEEAGAVVRGVSKKYGGWFLVGPQFVKRSFWRIFSRA